MNLVARVVLCVTAFSAPVLAQPAVPQGPDQIGEAIASAAKSADTSQTPATLVYTNRQIMTLRATILGRPPSTRAESVVTLLDRFATAPPAGQVTTETFDQGVLFRVDGHPVVVLFAADLDSLAGERLDVQAAAAAERLQLAVNEAVELHTPGYLLKAGLLVLSATVVYFLLIWIFVRLKRRLTTRIQHAAEDKLRRLPGGEVILTGAPGYVARLVMLVTVVVSLILTYQWLIFVLRQLPYTRPLGESLRSNLYQFVLKVGETFVNQLPNLSKVVVIILFTRFAIRLLTIAFNGAEEGRITLPWVYPETAQPTRRIGVALLWLLALILAYPYLPGSGSEVFKGASVFIGIIVSLGSSGVMNQIMSGLMVTYSRAVRVGDFVRIGEIEGVVTHLGGLSTKLTTPRNEEITIPNAVVVSHSTTNFSRNAREGGVMVPTSATIGYDVPWRQVEALMLLAAERTAGLRDNPKPVVLQTALLDAAVQYTLLVCLEQPERRVRILDKLHANIQDAFNEYGVQIMSPQYEADPNEPKVVPPSRWYASPASPPADAQSRAASTEKSGRGSLGTV